MKCRDCGYLAVRMLADRSLVEIEKSFRDTGKMPTGLMGNSIYDNFPLCFAGEQQFHDDIGDHPTTTSMVAAMAKDRECGSYYEWRLGHTPKEHLEMKILQEQRAWQRAQEEADRQWRETQAKQQHEWRQDDLARDRKRRNEDVDMAKEAMNITVRSYIVAAAIGFAGALAAVALTKWLG